jgi:hypothetical protein
MAIGAFVSALPVVSPSMGFTAQPVTRGLSRGVNHLRRPASLHCKVNGDARNALRVLRLH